MNQLQLERKLGKKIVLVGRALSEALTADEMSLVSFWTLIGNRVADRKAKRRVDEGSKYASMTDEEIENEVETEGQSVLNSFGGDARKALDRLL